MTVNKIVGVATDDPFSRSTFSGLSANLFGEIQRQGVTVDPITTRDFRWHDALGGALRFRDVIRAPSRKSSRMNPDWSWSRRTHELMTRRFRRKLASRSPDATILQVGTHVQAAGDSRRVFCVTDLTVAQALLSGRTYQVGRASRAVQQEALEWQKSVFDGCHSIFVLSDWAARSVISDYSIAAQKVIVVGAGANVPPQLPARRRNALSPAILFVGLDWEQKGGPLLLGAFRKVLAALPNAKLVVVGCRPAGLEQEPGVEILGRLNRSIPEEDTKLLRAYSEATCFCIAPAVDAFPNVLLEAGAFGLPVVSTDVGSRREVVQDRINGRLVRHDDVIALANALIELLADPEAAERFGAAGAKIVRDTLNWPHVVRIMLGHMDLI